MLKNPLGLRAIWEYRNIRIHLGRAFPTPKLFWVAGGVVVEERVSFDLTLDQVSGSKRLEIIRRLVSGHRAAILNAREKAPVHGDLYAGNVVLKGKEMSPVLLDLDPNTLGRGPIWLDPLTLILHNPTDTTAGSWVIQKFFEGAFARDCEFWFASEIDANPTKSQSVHYFCERWIHEFGLHSGWREEDLWLRIDNAISHQS